MGGNSSGTAEGFYGTLQVASAQNLPGLREGSVSWIDSQGKFWLFGGFGYDSAASLGDLNDLWRFNPATNEWAWMAGAKTVGQSGVYGTLGTPATANTPGARGYSMA
jgi:N-acetylneuraminic acid mutarotase